MLKLKCFECSQLFNNKDDIEVHLKCNHHLEDNLSNYKCIVEFDDETDIAPCTKQFCTLKALFVHVDLCVLHRNKLKGRLGRINNQKSK